MASSQRSWGDLQTPPTKAELEALFTALGKPAHEIIRTKEAPFADLGLADATVEAILNGGIGQHPILLEQPIVTHGTKATIGRPPENVLSLME